jgi:Protein of Unknown function (DUF2784)
MRLLAEVTMAVHFLVLAYIVLGAYLAWWRPWLILVHLPFALWGLGIATLGLTCPLTSLEDRLRGRAGPGFVERYVDGVLYPQQYLALSRAVAATVVVIGYAGTLVRWRRRHSRAAA